MTVQGVGTVHSPIVISDDEDEAIVELALEQRLSSPREGDYMNFDSYEGFDMQDHGYTAKSDFGSLPSNGRFTELYHISGITNEYSLSSATGLKRKRIEEPASPTMRTSLLSVTATKLNSTPAPGIMPPDAIPGESKNARKKRRKREKLATEALAAGTGLPPNIPGAVREPMRLPPLPITTVPLGLEILPPMTFSSNFTMQFPTIPPQLSPTDDLSLMPSPMQVPSFPCHLPPSPHIPSQSSFMVPQIPIHLSHLSAFNRPAPAPPPLRPLPQPNAPVGAPELESSALKAIKRTIGMPSDSAYSVKHGIFPLTLHSGPAPNPDRTLVMELMPKKFRNHMFVRTWALNFGPHPRTDPRIELDSKSGKALIEFGNAEAADAAWESKRLSGEGKEHIRVWWYVPSSLEAMDVDGTRELEEGEIEDGEIVKPLTVPMKKKVKKEKKKAKEVAESERFSGLQNGQNQAFHPIPAPSVPPLSNGPSQWVPPANGRHLPPQPPAITYGLPFVPSHPFHGIGIPQWPVRSQMPISTLSNEIEEAMDLGSDDGQTSAGPELSHHRTSQQDAHPITSSRLGSPLEIEQSLMADLSPIQAPSVEDSHAHSVWDAHLSKVLVVEDETEQSPRTLTPSVDLALSGPGNSFKTVSTPSNSTSTPPSEPRAMKNLPKGPSHLRQALLARQKELEEKIARSRLEIASRSSKVSSGTETPVTEAPATVKDEITAAILTSTTSMVVSSPTSAVLPSAYVDENTRAKEEDLRRLVLNSRRKTTIPSAPSTPSESNKIVKSTPNTKTVTEVAVKETRGAAMTERTNIQASLNLDDLAISFIAESIQTVTPLISTPTPALSSIPKSRTPPLISSSSPKELLAAKQQLLQRHINESKALMARLGATRSKVEKDAIISELKEKTRLMEEQMEALTSAPIQSVVKAPQALFTRWPSFNTCILEISDDEDDE